MYPLIYKVNKMATSLGELQLDTADPIFYSERFRAIVEQNLEFLKTATHGESKPITYATLTDAEAVAYEGDFRKVATHLNIPQHLIWIVMRDNDLLNYEDYTRDLKELIVPDYNLIYKLQLDTAIIQTNI